MAAILTPNWLRIRRGDAPLIVSIPHAGIDLAHVRAEVRSAWLATLDADWWVDRLYDFAADLDATIVSTSISRTVIDVNRDAQSRSLYPGLPTTALVPTTTFDGEPLYARGHEPTEQERALRRATYFDPYHAVLGTELRRLRDLHPKVVLYDAHSIRSHVPRLFEGELPLFNVGTYDGRSCSEQLTASVVSACTGFSGSFVVNGRFKGGAITRTYGRPDEGIHAIQMELACRAYIDEPTVPLDEQNWPPQYSTQRAAPTRNVLRDVLQRCSGFARNSEAS
jgi:N-formylglutamate deformylase